MPALLLVLVLGAGSSVPGVDSPPAANASSGGATHAEQYTGLCVPLNATDLLAPEASFKVAGWSSNWGQHKIMELAKDGEAVKQGQVVARYEFIGKEALRHVQDRIQEAEAARAQALIAADQTLEALQVEARRLELEAKLAAVDIQKAPLVSKRQQALFDIRHQIATFEAEAVLRRVRSASQARAAEIALQDRTVSLAERDMGRYRFYEHRFSALAPHDGVVRHAFHPKERRKVQKGDSIGPGQKLASLAKDELLGVRFYVPEHRFHVLREGMVVIATGASGEEHRAVVKKVDFFPQELGFLLELPTIPNAREKAFAVTAELTGPAVGLSAGTELKVRVLPDALVQEPAPGPATVSAGDP